MRTLTLALILTAPTLAQPPAPTDAAPAASATPAAKPADLSPEAQTILDRAAAVYKGVKTYRETVLVTVNQKASNILKETEPPADQAVPTSFTWGGPDRFAFDSRDFALFRNGKEGTILVKALGQYVQREPQDEDKPIFINLIESRPTYMALTGETGAPGKPPFGSFTTAKEVKAEELRGVKGKRVIGSAPPPLFMFSTPVPVTMFFADDTGLLLQATYDLKAAVQAQLEANANAASEPRDRRAVIEKYTVTSDWTVAQADPTPAIEGSAFALKPGPGDQKVDAFNPSDDQDSVQHTLLNKPAPDFTTTTLDGTPWSLKDQRGKVVLLQFWSATNQMSTRSLHHFNSMDMVYKEMGVVMVGVNQDDPSMIKQTRRLVAEKSAAFPMLVDADKAIGNAFRVAILPRTIIIDKEGVIRSFSTDFDSVSQVEVADKLSDLLAGRPIQDRPKPAPFQVPPQPGATPAAPATPASPAPPTPEPKKP